jgi:hypothetical protein
MIYAVTVVIAFIGIIVWIVIHAHRKALEQQKASDMRLQAMFRATTKAAAAKKAPAAAQPAPPGPGAAAASGLREERECPFCAEPILKRARVCKHCGRDVEPLA